MGRAYKTVFVSAMERTGIYAVNLPSARNCASEGNNYLAYVACLHQHTPPLISRYCLDRHSVFRIEKGGATQGGRNGEEEELRRKLARARRQTSHSTGIKR